MVLVFYCCYNYVWQTRPAPFVGLQGKGWLCGLLSGFTCLQLTETYCFVCIDAASMRMCCLVILGLEWQQQGAWFRHVLARVGTLVPSSFTFSIRFVHCLLLRGFFLVGSMQWMVGDASIARRSTSYACQHPQKQLEAWLCSQCRHCFSCSPCLLLCFRTTLLSNSSGNTMHLASCHSLVSRWWVQLAVLLAHLSLDNSVGSCQAVYSCSTCWQAVCRASLYCLLTVCIHASSSHGWFLQPCWHVLLSTLLWCLPVWLFQQSPINSFMDGHG
jgi:hypothetical protein